MKNPVLNIQTRQKIQRDMSINSEKELKLAQIDNFHRNILRDPNWGAIPSKSLAGGGSNAQTGNNRDMRNMAGLPPPPIINKMADKSYLKITKELKKKEYAHRLQQVNYVERITGTNQSHLAKKLLRTPRNAK